MNYNAARRPILSLSLSLPCVPSGELSVASRRQAASTKSRSAVSRVSWAPRPRRSCMARFDLEAATYGELFIYY